MRLSTFSAGGARLLGAALDDTGVIDVHAAAADLGHDVPAGGLRELVEDGGFDAVRGLLAAAADRDAAPWRHDVSAVTFHHPYRPRKNVVRAGGNSRTLNGAEPDGAVVQQSPGRWLTGFPVRYYTKAPTAVLDPGAPIVWPARITSQVYAEPQLAIVVGAVLDYATPAQAQAGVAGYAVGTDVTAHDLKLRHGQWPKAASLDSFFPWGPHIVTADEVPNPDGLAVSLALNGTEVISGSTKDTVLSVGEVLAQLSTGIRLEPGDVVLLGAAEHVGLGSDPARWLAGGDRLTSTIEGIGSLSNPVAHPYESMPSVRR